jgi:uncharacterized protein (DUF58 family)
MTAADLDALDRLVLHVRRGMGERPGDRRFPGRTQPAGIEIEAHAAYAPGDDLRHLDWNALGRLDALLVRRFTAEREVVVHLLVDASASMGVPARDRKLDVAADLARALAHVALAANDGVRVAILRNDRPAAVSPVLRHRTAAGRVGELLAAAEPRGALAIGDALAEHARLHPAPGLAIVLSDLMADPDDVAHGVGALRARRYEVVLIQVLGRGDVDPAREFSAGVLADAESGATHPVVLTTATLARYRALLDAHLAALAAVAERAGAVHARLVTGASVRDFVALELRRLGVVRRR